MILNSIELFSKRLKMLREERGWDQVQLADQLETSKSNISMYESGKRKPGYDMLCKMVEVFGESSDFIMGINNVRKQKKIAQ